VGESAEVLGRAGTIASNESVQVAALRRVFLPTGKCDQVMGHRSGETKVGFFKGEKGEMFRSTVCWVPQYSFQIIRSIGFIPFFFFSDPSDLSHILLLPSQHFSLTSLFLKYTFLMLLAL
jgi:hypothetical protein